ncbi:MAG: hypothetical protein E6J87_05810 [Deltaproteobacteria bacterium]|nr:MAG: hypothetical protein E6J87_05810 [Deltaproteobacteria bacterium]
MTDRRSVDPAGIAPSHATRRSRLLAAVGWADLWVGAVALAAAGRILRLIDRHAVNVPFWDQFSLYQALARDTSAWGLFRWQHGPHRQGLPFLLVAALARATDWNARGDAFLTGALSCTAAALALWLRRRLSGPFHAADAAIPLLVLTPAQYGIFIHTPNPSHGAGPLVLLLALCLAFTAERRALRYPLLVAIDFVLVHTGFGMIAAPLVPALLGACTLCDARSSGARAAVLPAVCALLALASAALFWVGYDTRDLAEVAAPAPFAAYALYVALMFADVLGLKGGGVLALLGGSLAAVAALAVAAEQLVRLLRADPGAPRRMAVLALTSFSLLFAAATAYGRIALGFPGAQSTRYVPLLVPAFLGVYLRLQEVRRLRLRAALLGASALAIALAGVPMRASEARFMEHLSRGKRAWVAAYLATGDVAQANARAGLRIFPFDDPGVPQLLEYMRERRLGFFAGVQSPSAGGALSPSR